MYDIKLRDFFWIMNWTNGPRKFLLQKSIGKSLLLRAYGIWDFMGIFWDFMGFYGILWDFSGFFGGFFVFFSDWSQRMKNLHPWKDNFSSIIFISSSSLVTDWVVSSMAASTTFIFSSNSVPCASRFHNVSSQPSILSLTCPTNLLYSLIFSPLSCNDNDNILFLFLLFFVHISKTWINHTNIIE